MCAPRLNGKKSETAMQAMQVQGEMLHDFAAVKSMYIDIVG